MDLMENPKFTKFITEFSKLRDKSKNSSLEEARKQSTDFFCPPELPREPVNKIENIHVNGREGHHIPVRIYTPKYPQEKPILIFFHRGGWVFSNIEESDPVCRKFANHLGCIVASVEYRLAPENPFPKPFHDCYDAFLSIAAHASEIGAKEDKIIVGGESVGGNMAAAVALRARDEDAPAIAAQLLIYPVISSTFNDTAYAESKDQYFITREAMDFFWKMYIQDPKDLQNPYASPDKASDYRNLPPALVVTAEHDPLRLEGAAYAQRMKQAGNRVIVENFPDVVHGFLDLPVYNEGETLLRLKKIEHILRRLINTPFYDS